jgi:hypothetical protein
MTSLEDLTSATQRQGFSEVNQNRIISISGLLPQSSVASTYHYKDSRSPSTAFGITNTPSYLLESRIDGPELADLIEIRKQVIEARAAASRAIASRLAIAGARARLREESERNEPSATLMTALADEERAARAEYTSARDSFDTELNEAIEAVNVPGVLVMRWQTSDSSSGDFSLDSMLGFSRSHDLATSGFAILGGLRLTTLFVGPEVANLDPGSDRRWDWGLHYYFSGLVPCFLGRTYDNVRLTTHILQAQNVLYLQDAEIEEKARFALDAGAAQLADLSETVRNVERIEFEYIVERLNSLSNLGVIGSLERRVFPAAYAILGSDRESAIVLEVIDEEELDFVSRKHTGRPYTSQKEVLEADRLADGRKVAEAGNSKPSQGGGSGQPQESWHTIYVVDTDLSTLQELFD